MNRRTRLPRRGFVALAVASGLATTACYDSTWVVQRELGPFRLPRRVVIAVWKSPRVRELDGGGITDTLVVALAEELNSRGFFPTVTALDDAPVLPRVELVFWTPPSETAGTGRAGQTGITVDCAFVSAKDEVEFVGRVRGYGKDGDVAVAVQAAARAITDALAGG
jgi:hypothetical protein